MKALEKKINFERDLLRICDQINGSHIEKSKYCFEIIKLLSQEISSADFSKGFGNILPVIVLIANYYNYFKLVQK